MKQKFGSHVSNGLYQLGMFLFCMIVPDPCGYGSALCTKKDAVGYVPSADDAKHVMTRASEENAIMFAFAKNYAVAGRSDMN